MPLTLFVDAKDSQGKNVDLKLITTEGSVNPQVLGDYPILFSFTDPHTNEQIKAMTMVTVVTP